jgi:thymidylate synthase ThyX
MSYEAKVIADSIAHGTRLTTLEVNFPRFILAEINTHRVFSRNSASSRAIPTMKLIARVDKDPFIPTHWLANQAGMQAAEPLSVADSLEATLAWLELRDASVKCAERLNALNVHKQWANRPLELHGWHRCIITATEWENFWNLRISKLAQPEFNAIAVLAKAAYDESTPKHVPPQGWHLPYILDDELGTEPDDVLAHISAARCARVSYLTHDGKRDIQVDLDLAEKLYTNRHMSPFEHPARVAGFPGVELDHDPDEFIGNFRAPWRQLRKYMPGERVAPRTT